MSATTPVPSCVAKTLAGARCQHKPAVGRLCELHAVGALRDLGVPEWAHASVAALLARLPKGEA